MNVHDVLKFAFGTSHYILTSYIKDLDQKDLLLRPVEGMNPIAWQLGHLIASEYTAIEAIKPGSCPDLPEGFLDRHAKDGGKVTPDTEFSALEEYLSLFEAQRAATMAVLEGLSPEDLDAPGPESMRDYAPTVGAALLMQSMHETMHTGQFVAVRRLSQKPVVI